MKQYQRALGLRSIYLTLVRRYHIILCIFLPFLLISFISTQLIMKKTYYSDTVLAKSTVITNEQYQNIQQTVSSANIVQKTVDYLSSNKIKHSNGDEITKSDVLNGIVFPAYTSNSLRATFSFKSNDKAITTHVLNELATESVLVLRQYSSLSDLSVYSNASTPRADSKNTKYFLVFSGIGLGLGLVGAFVYELICDEVYDKRDVEVFGESAYEVKTSKKKKVKKYAI